MELSLRPPFKPNGGVYVLDYTACKSIDKEDEAVLKVLHKGNEKCGDISATESGVGLFHHIINFSVCVWGGGGGGGERDRHLNNMWKKDDFKGTWLVCMHHSIDRIAYTSMDPPWKIDLITLRAMTGR